MIWQIVQINTEKLPDGPAVLPLFIYNETLWD